MKVRIALSLCLALSVIFSTQAWTAIMAMGDPTNPLFGPDHFFRHPLSRAWLWSHALLPLLVGLSYTRWHLPVFAGMATVLYTPIYVVWASFFAGPNGLHPDMNTWIVMPLVVTGFESTFILRLTQKKETTPHADIA